MASTLPETWIRIAAVYFVIAVALGVFMGASHDHSLFSLHAHLNLLGWVSMVLFGLIGNAYPQLNQSLLAKLHFWIYNASLPVMAVALFGVLKGNAGMEPVLGIVSATTALAIVFFAANVLLNLPKKNTSLSGGGTQARSAAMSDTGLLTHN
ncbi:MAG: hypothetical protein QM709_04755 [Spongiibacteraceae bacterium]